MDSIDTKELFHIDEAEEILNNAVNKLLKINGYISFVNEDGSTFYLKKGFKVNITAFIGDRVPTNP